MDERLKIIDDIIDIESIKLDIQDEKVQILIQKYYETFDLILKEMGFDPDKLKNTDIQFQKKCEKSPRGFCILDMNDEDRFKPTQKCIFCGEEIGS